VGAFLLRDEIFEKCFSREILRLVTNDYGSRGEKGLNGWTAGEKGEGGESCFFSGGGQEKKKRGILAARRRARGQKAEVQQKSNLPAREHVKPFSPSKSGMEDDLDRRMKEIPKSKGQEKKKEAEGSRV